MASAARTGADRGRNAANARSRPAVPSVRTEKWFRARWPSSIADPRVEPGDGYIHENIQHDENHGVKEYEILHHKDITLIYRGIHREAETRRGEGALDRD